MKIKNITQIIEEFAPKQLQESYDNCGLIIGCEDSDVSSVLLCIDITEDTIDEAKSKNCGLVISHHPLIFKGIRSITGKNYIERCIAKAIKNNIAIYAAHTNIDIANNGVSHKIAEKLNLKNKEILVPKQYTADNEEYTAGLGIVGDLPEEMNAADFIQLLKQKFSLKIVKHSKLLGKKIRRVALCGGSGSAFVEYAKRANADIYFTGDISYHTFFEAENQLVIADIGHFESEQFTKEIFCEIITKKIPNFAVILTENDNNIISYS